jgi:tRNA(fMet)-specific endonuclease VapC
MVIDTNIYSGLKQSTPSTLKLLVAEKRLAVPLPVIAELKFGFVNGTRSALNRATLDDFLAQTFVEVLFPTLQTCDLYAELRLHTKQLGKSLSNNDVWIAALAREDGDTLVTYDKDFSVFQELFGGKLKVLP